MSEPECQLGSEHKMCCCNCRSQYKVITYKNWPEHTQIGFACVVQEWDKDGFGAAVIDWPKHLCGCEMYIPRREK